jgi:uncharacterized membrane protein YraQ (UPF0718 family)/copper chaperone CopZ
MNTLIQVGAETWTLTAEMAPYLLFGFALAGALSVFIREETVGRHLGGRGLGAACRAAMIGVPLPLCSCGVIPVAASLRRHGAGKGATLSFRASTPQTGVDSIAATWGLLGPLFAGIRVVVAFLTGLIAGTLTDRFAGEDRAAPAPTPSPDRPAKKRSPGESVVAALRYGFWTLPKDIGMSLLVGLILAGMISSVLPDSFFAGHFGGSWLAYLAALAVAIPMYVCSTGSIPLATAMISAGISPGAALVFLIAGPATNTATLATTYRLFGGKITAIYLLTLILCALGAGILLDTFLPAAIAVEPTHRHAEGIGWMQHLCGLLLIATIAGALIARPKHGSIAEPTPDNMTENDLFIAGIEGMTCSHCAASVERGLGALPGVHAVSVDLSAKQARIEARALPGERIASEIRALGFEVRSVEQVRP